MRKHYGQTTTQQPGGGESVKADTEGGIIRTNLNGNEHLTLLSMGEMDEALNHSGLLPVDALLALLRDGDRNREVVIEEPRPHVFEVLAIPTMTGFGIDGWALTVRDVTDTPQEPADSQPPGQSSSVFHWPPNSSLTSNIR